MMGKLVPHTNRSEQRAQTIGPLAHLSSAFHHGWAGNKPEDKGKEDWAWEKGDKGKGCGMGTRGKRVGHGNKETRGRGVAWGQGVGGWGPETRGR